VEWAGESSITARQALAPIEEEERAGADRARELLLEVLGDGQPHPQREVVREVVRAADVSERTVRRVAAALKVVSARTGWGRGAVYTWTLPTTMLATHSYMASMRQTSSVSDVIPGHYHAGQPHAGQATMATMASMGDRDYEQVEREAIQGEGA